MQTKCVISTIAETGKIRYATLIGNNVDELKQHALKLLSPGERCMFVFENKVYFVVCS